MSRPTQLAMFLPNPLPTCELKRTTSFPPSFLSRDFAQSPVGTITASWNILNCFCFVKCRQRSHESRKRLGHLPGEQFFLFHRYSSVQSPPGRLTASTSPST